MGSPNTYNPASIKKHIFNGIPRRGPGSLTRGLSTLLTKVMALYSARGHPCALRY